LAPGSAALWFLCAPVVQALNHVAEHLGSRQIKAQHLAATVSDALH